MGKERNPIYSKAYELYLSGLSLSQVANKINVSRQCVYKAFKKRGFLLRGKNFNPIQEYDGKKFSLRPSGYFALTNNKRTLMHRYVWIKENGPIPDGWDVHHINGIKSDNRIENLECLSKSDHTKKYATGNNQFGRGKKKVEMINKEGVVVRVFDSTVAASNEMNISKSAICFAISGKTKFCLKHKWRYESN